MKLISKCCLPVSYNVHEVSLPSAGHKIFLSITKFLNLHSLTHLKDLQDFTVHTVVK